MDCEDDIFSRLAAPFPPECVRWRPGYTTNKKQGNAYPKGTKTAALAYIDSRDVMDRLDTVVGPGNWQQRFSSHGSTMICELGVKVNEEWVWKSDGAGVTDIEGIKGQLSDALKRAAVHWGIGRYLYSVHSEFVEIDEKGRFTEAAKAKLNAALTKTTDFIEHGDRADRNTFRLLTVLAEEFESSQLRDVLNGNRGITANLPKAQQEELRNIIDRMVKAEQEAA